MRQLGAIGRTLASSSLVRNSLALISGTVLTQAIVFLCSPFLSRIFGPPDFANLANFNAWVAILALAGSLRYEHAVFVASDRDTVDRVLALTLALSLVSVILCLVVAIVLYVVAPATGYLHNIHGILLLVPVGVLVVGVSSPLTQLNVRVGHFKRLASIAVAQMVCTIVPQLALGALHVQNALILGTIAGYVMAGVVLGLALVREDGLHGIGRHMRPESLIKTARQFVNFPRFTLPADAINVIAQQFIPVFILALFDPAVAGLYSFSMRIIRVPLIVVSTAVSSALRKGAADHLRRPAGLLPLFRATAAALGAIGFVPFVVMLLFSHQIFAAVFGARWAEAGHVVQILSPGILLEFVAFPLSVFFLVTSTQFYTFAVQAAGFVLMVAALLVGRYSLGSFIATCYLLSAVMVAVNVASLVLGMRVAAHPHAPNSLSGQDLPEPVGALL